MEKNEKLWKVPFLQMFVKLQVKILELVKLHRKGRSHTRKLLHGQDTVALLLRQCPLYIAKYLEGGRSFNT